MTQFECAEFKASIYNCMPEMRLFAAMTKRRRGILYFTVAALSLFACSSPRQNADEALNLSLNEQGALIKVPTFSGFQFEKQVNDTFFYTGTTKEVYTDRTLTNTIRAEVQFQYVKVDLGSGLSFNCTADLDRKTASCH